MFKTQHFLSLSFQLLDSARQIYTYHIHGADAQIVVLGGFVVESTSRRHDNDARAGIDGEGAVAVAVGDLEQQARDGSTLYLNHKSPAAGILEHVRRVFALQESGQEEKKKKRKKQKNNKSEREKQVWN
jgi:hypothetical protein